MERNAKLLKYLDRYFGIPMIALIGILKKRRHKPKEIRSIGIFAFAAIGDSILSSILITSIKRAWPDAKIVIFASKANAPIYSVLSGFDELVVLPITKPWKALPILRKYSVDVLIDTSQWPRLGALYVALANARWSVGFKTAEQYRAAAYDVAVEHSSRCHEVDNFKRLLDPLGIEPDSRLALAENLKNTKNLKLVLPTEKYVVLHPWASGSNYQLREWPSAHWSSLAKELAKSNIEIVVSGSAADELKANQLAQELNLGDKVRVIAGKTSLAEFSNILLHAQACISVNTGVAHLAASLNVPTVALNGPTNANRWGIRGENVINLNVSQAQGGAFLSLGFEYPQNPNYIMNQISVATVLGTLNELDVLG
jgi:ADP-heptose:LPS heptosyltransferase